MPTDKYPKELPTIEGYLSEENIESGEAAASMMMLSGAAPPRVSQAAGTPILSNLWTVSTTALGSR